MRSKWIKTYIDLLRQGNETDAHTLKLSNIPKSLFKYRVLNENTLNSLKYNGVWISKAESQNDPYECSLSFSDKEMALAIYTRKDFKEQFLKNYRAEITEEEIDNIIKNDNPEQKFRETCQLKNIDRDYSDLSIFREESAHNLIRKVKSKIRISSFSERNDSILMWSHYSENHRGICIEYDLHNDFEIAKVLEPVYYSEKIVSLSKAFGNQNSLNIIREAVITKALDWQYEKEWRIVFPTERNGYYKLPKPKNVYLGSRFNENEKGIYREYLLDYCSKNKIFTQQMQNHETEYKIIKNE